MATVLKKQTFQEYKRTHGHTFEKNISAGTGAGQETWCCEPEIAEQMKQKAFFVRLLGADPQPYGVYGEGLQRRMAEKDAVSCFVIFGS